MDNINHISNLLEKVKKESTDVESRKRLREIERDTPSYIIKSIVPQKGFVDRLSLLDLKKQNRSLEEILAIGEERLLLDPWNIDVLLNLSEIVAEASENKEYFNVAFYMFKDITERAIQHHVVKEEKKNQWLFNAYRMLLIAYSKQGDFENANKIREVSEAYLLNKDSNIAKELDDLVADAYSNKLKKEGDEISKKKRVETDIAAQKREKERSILIKKNTLLEDALKLYESAKNREDYLQAIQILQKTAQEHERETKAISLLHLGLCYEALSKSSLCPESMDQLVLECYKKALDSGIESSELWKDILYIRANVYEKQGNSQKAAEDLLRIFSVDVNYKDVAERIIPGIKFKNRT